MSGALGWLRARLGVRVVTSLAAALSVAVVLLLAGAALVLLTDRILRDTVQETALQQATVVAQRVEANFEDDVEKNADDATAKRGDLVQVVRDYDPNGAHDIEVIGASNPLWSVGPISDDMPAPGIVEVDRSEWVTYRDGMEEDDPEITEEVLVVAYGASVKGRDIVVYAAQPLEQVHDAVETVFRLALDRDPAAGTDHGNRHLPRRRPGPAAGRGDPGAGGDDPRPVGAGAGAPGARRGRAAGRDDERDARPAAGGPGRAAPLRRGRQPRAAQPLATIATGLELLSRGDADRDTVTALRGETERLGRLVDALLLLARADESGLRPRFEDVDLDEVAEAERLRPAGRIVPRIEASHVRVVGDRGQLAQVVRNLVDNACRHARSTVVVSVRREGHELSRPWTSPTTVRVCRPTSGRGCSSGSSASTTRGRARTAAPGWGWRSSRRWSRRTAAPWTSSTARWAGRCSGCGCRFRTRPSPRSRRNRRRPIGPARCHARRRSTSDGVGSAIR